MNTKRIGELAARCEEIKRDLDGLSVEWVGCMKRSDAGAKSHTVRVRSAAAAGALLEIVRNDLEGELYTLQSYIRELSAESPVEDAPCPCGSGWRGIGACPDCGTEHGRIL